MTENQPIRRREIHWEDPSALQAASRETDGLGFLRDILEGKRPPAPIMCLLGMAFSDISRGLVVMRLAPQECHYNPLGAVHGGVIATLLDSVMGCAVHSTLPARRGYTTLEIKVNYVRPVTVEVSDVRARGRVLHAGRRTATAEGMLSDASNLLYAHATTTCLLFDRTC